MIDEELWQDCLELTSGRSRGEMPEYLGKILEPESKVWLVDGNEVKVEHDMDFVEANNSEESPSYIPKNCIWLDGLQDAGEWAFNLYHEAHEVRDMRGGMSYAAAHKRANEGERALRKRVMEGEE